MPDSPHPNLHVGLYWMTANCWMAADLYSLLYTLLYWQVVVLTSSGNGVYI